VPYTPGCLVCGPIKLQSTQLLDSSELGFRAGSERAWWTLRESRMQLAASATDGSASAISAQCLDCSLKRSGVECVRSRSTARNITTAGAPPGVASVRT